jgi:hypothetical protein
MKASELIEILEELKEKHGDAEVEYIEGADSEFGIKTVEFDVVFGEPTIVLS